MSLRSVQQQLQVQAARATELIRSRLWQIGERPLEQLRVSFNQVTGYEDVLRHKEEVSRQYQSLEKIKKAISEQRVSANDLSARMVRIQNELSKLMAERNQIAVEKTPFATQRRLDIANQLQELFEEERIIAKSEAECKDLLLVAERELDLALTHYTNCLLTRYNVEQAWSDKIRMGSTYTTVALFGLNASIFLLSQLYLIPRHQKKLVNKIGLNVDESIQKLEGSLHRNYDERASQASQARADEQVKSGEDKEELLKRLEAIESLIQKLEKDPPKQAEEDVQAPARLLVADPEPSSGILLANPRHESALMLGACIVAATCSVAVLAFQLAR